MYLERKAYPSIKQASTFYLILTIALLVLSGFNEFLGQGVNTCINELIFIIPPAILGLKNKWSWSNVYKFKKTNKNVIFLSVILGIGVWIFDYHLANLINIGLDNLFGKVIIQTDVAQKLQQSTFQIVLLIIALTILAPICEEIFFRGFIQGTFEKINYNKSWIITGVLFGMIHFLVGISSGIPNIFHGLILSYILFKTQSIWATITIHAANNFCAAFLSGVLKNSSIFSNSILWLTIGLLIVVTIIILISKKCKVEQHISEFNNTVKINAKSIGVFISTIVILLGIGGLEIAIRVGAIAV